MANASRLLQSKCRVCLMSVFCDWSFIAFTEITTILTYFLNILLGVLFFFKEPDFAGKVNKTAGFMPCKRVGIPLTHAQIEKSQISCKQFNFTKHSVLCSSFNMSDAVQVLFPVLVINLYSYF